MFWQLKDAHLPSEKNPNHKVHVFSGDEMSNLNISTSPMGIISQSHSGAQQGTQ
jgi:hypothetical protein